jgi:hypothetical protein
LRNWSGKIITQKITNNANLLVHILVFIPESSRVHKTKAAFGRNS